MIRRYFCLFFSFFVHHFLYILFVPCLVEHMVGKHISKIDKRATEVNEAIGSFQNLYEATGTSHIAHQVVPITKVQG